MENRRQRIAPNRPCKKFCPTASRSGLDRAMCKPDRSELEATMLAFILLAPLGYWIVRTAFSLIG